MNNPESLRKLLHCMSDFRTVYNMLRYEISNYESDTGESVNDIPGFTEYYPFDKSFNDMYVNLWVDNTIDRVRSHAFKVICSNYLNTGGNCMVGIYHVWIPAEKRVVYALTNEEGCTLTVVDYISNDLAIDDYDELIIDTIEWGRCDGTEKYFDLYRYCYNEYIKSDCRHFGYVTAVPFHLLSDDLQSQVNADYLVWLESNGIDYLDTDGFKIVVHPDYPGFDLQGIKDFRVWHDALPTYDDRRGCLYDLDYVLTFDGRSVSIPFNADTYDAVDSLLKTAVELC